MFVIELTYTAGLPQIDAYMAAHVAFLKKYYAAGHFLVSGRQIPRQGGIILALLMANTKTNGGKIQGVRPEYLNSLFKYSGLTPL